MPAACAADAEPGSVPPDSEATYRVVVEYDGTDFCGFQFQPQVRTIAGTLESTFSRLFDQPVKLSCAGRTDAGVHAVGQVVSFRSHARFPIDKFAIAANSALPGDLSVREAARVASDFNARGSALERRYTYVLLNRKAPSAVLRRYTHFEHRSLDFARMRAAAALLAGEHDFVSFCGVLPEHGGTVRTLHGIEIERAGELVRLHFRAAGFLHRMVRTIAGTLLEIGAGRRAVEDIPAILAARDRRAAGFTAPAQGLFFVGARYACFDSASRAAFATVLDLPEP
jgi:tRNA pseudouridine38-40 synthase